MDLEHGDDGDDVADCGRDLAGVERTVGRRKKSGRFRNERTHKQSPR